MDAYGELLLHTAAQDAKFLLLSIADLHRNPYVNGGIPGASGIAS
jgi:hypothetical protein